MSIAKIVTSLAILSGLCAGESRVIAASSSHPAASNVFVGTTPCGERMKTLLQLPSAGSDALRWKLTLELDPKSREPARYKLECQFVLTPGPNSGEKVTHITQREGACTVARGTKANPEGVVIELEHAFSVVQVTENILHILEPDRSLMVGTGGYSYTLNRAEVTEKPGDLALALARPSVSYTNTPLANGPAVFGVFEGRSPCLGISRELKMPEDAGCIKAKWRITLFQDPETKTPTTYKVEGGLYRGRAREGKWSITQGTARNSSAVVYSLAPIPTEPELCFLKGDDNVLFFLNQGREPMVGHAEFSYTLNRRL